MTDQQRSFGRNHLTLDSVLGYLFGILWIVGGFIGYFKSSSTTSLVAGSSVGLLAIAGVFFAAQFQDKEWWIKIMWCSKKRHWVRK